MVLSNMKRGDFWKWAATVVLLVTGLQTDVLGQVTELEEDFEIRSAQQKLGTTVNTPYYEANPIISADGKTLYFNRFNHPGNLGGTDDPSDVWYAELKENGTWSEAKNVGRPINDEGENLLLGFMDEGRAMLLHHPNGFAFSYKNEGDWLKPTPYEIPFFSNAAPEKSGSISYNGRYMVFALESFGTYGVEDIYMTKITPAGTWTPLKNLGSTINTRFQEVTPMLAPDNRTLFFASNGHGGEGSFDIFMTERVDDTWRNWTEPKNLGNLINTKGADKSFNFQPDGEFAYMTSTENSEGYSDIKRVMIMPEFFDVDTTNRFADEVEEIAEVVEKPEKVLPDTALANLIFYKGVILDGKNNKPLVGTVRFEGDGGKLIEVQSFLDGQFTAELPKDHVYEMTVKVDEYYKIDTTFMVSGDYESETIPAFYMEPLTVGNKIKLNNVLFYQGTADLMEGSEKELDILAEMMRDNPELEIFLEGHTDNRGNFNLNLELSRERVDVVKDYLVKKGISSERIEGKGFGSTRPIASNQSEKTRQLNRRVEFEIIKN